MSDHADAALRLRVYAHAMREEEQDLSFAEFGVAKRRYPSPGDLAADIGRHLKDEPVLAGPPSQTYRLKKFVRRNKSRSNSSMPTVPAKGN